MSYDKILILGTGRLAIDAAAHCKSLGLPVSVYDMNPKASELMKRQCNHYDVECNWLPAKETSGEISKMSVKLLLVSAINPYILPASLLKLDNITAINCHQALLPRHPGRNAEMWAIYEGDEKVGITWHYITAQVDDGDILLQKDFPLTETMTSYQVFRKQIQLAFEAFKELLPQLLAGSITGIPQDFTKKEALHYSWDMPGDGILDPCWSGEKISAFLRAVDYAGLAVLKQPKIYIDNICYFWKKYKIHQDTNEPDGISTTKDTITIYKDGYEINLLNYFKEEQ